MNPGAGIEGRRAIATGAFGAALSACNPRRLIGDAVAHDRGNLRVCGKGFPAKRVFVVGAGKASGAMALALEKKIPVEAGVVVGPQGCAMKFRTERIRLMESTHPYPSQKSEAAAKAMLALAQKTGVGDAVVSLISGGGSALLELPKPGISLEEITEVSRLMMHAGVGIGELNSVRQCLSQVKGGGLAAAFPKATIINVVISDVLGSPIEVIASGPTVKCRVSRTRARKILVKYGLGKNPAAKAALAVIEKTTTDYRQMPEIQSFVLADNDFAVDAAAGHLRGKGLAPMTIKRVQGEAREVGKNLAKLLNNGVCFVAGGETTVCVKGKGKGGRSQELALSAATGLRRGVLLAAGTDGVDGNSDAAGAIVDYETVKKARKKGLDARGYLKDNDSNSFFRRLGGALVQTGPTGTNVCDIIIGIP